MSLVFSKVISHRSTQLLLYGEIKIVIEKINIFFFFFTFKKIFEHPKERTSSGEEGNGIKTQRRGCI